MSTSRNTAGTHRSNTDESDSQISRTISIYYGKLELVIYEEDGVRWCKRVPVPYTGYYVRVVNVHPLCEEVSPSEIASNYGGKVLHPGLLTPKPFTSRAPQQVHKSKKNEDRQSKKRRYTKNPRNNKS